MGEEVMAMVILSYGMCRIFRSRFLRQCLG